MKDDTVVSQRRAIRAAIYTRKSSDEGLDQAFNSLDAQREACAAYIASQRHEGWRELPARFDDGGVSGGTLDRPAIQRLLSEIDAGRVEMVVVYKIDRLTRSLADFAQLVDRFDRAGCSFVSVTQAFNTATSMGRLTLNILLSFAQFEREVTGERIRDRIAASKKKGLWMGGLPPLGYDVKRDGVERALVVNPIEAETVKLLFQLYDSHETLREVRDAAARQGLRSKLRQFESGRIVGGSVMTAGQIHYLLCNPIYVGRVRHKDQDYPGQHQPILEEALFARVQEKLQARSRRRRVRDKSTGALREPRTRSPLAGRVFDESGDRLTPTHSQRRGRRYRYYVSHRLISLKGSESARGGWRLPAEALERAVASAIAKHLQSLQDRLFVTPTPELAARIESDLAALVTTLVRTRGTPLQKLAAKIEIAPGSMTVKLDPEAIA
ncbi:MAG: recombinase family protein, partial [Pseudomonadota bacterium]